MGGFFGAVSKRDVVLDVFFGVDYHSHLGTHRGGIAAWSRRDGFQRAIHSIENTPFRTKFEKDVVDMEGTMCIGCISDKEPQPILIRSHLGTYAICFIGRINNADELVEDYLSRKTLHFDVQSGGRVNNTELVATLIDQRDTIAEGIAYAQNKIDGSACIIVATENQEIYAARDKMGRLPVMVGKDENGYAIALESFAYQKLDYADYYQLGPGECVRITPEECTTVTEPSGREKFCGFMWTYFGYPNSHYEGASVEAIRYRSGEIMARNDDHILFDRLDAVCGVPDSGLPYAMGFAQSSGVPFKRPFIKYTPTWPRSFMPDSQKVRDHIAKMKMIPVPDLIKGKKLLFIDDSIVRGTQLQGTVQFLYDNGADEVHMRSGCPPIMYGCKFLNFARNNSDMDLISRRTIQQLEGDEGQKHIGEYASEETPRGKQMRQCICKQLGFDSLKFQSLEGLIESIGLPKDKICTYCWTGEE